MTTAAQQAHFDRLVAVFADPDGTVEVIQGRDWARIHPKVCPVCGRVFYGWKPLDVDWEPFVVDPVPPPGSPSRQTCGHPLCWKAEDEARWHDKLRAMPRATGGMS